MKSRQGLSLLEVVIALAMVLSTTGVVMYGLVAGVDQSRRAEDALLETLVTQSLFNQIHDASAQNPVFFASLEGQYGFRRTRPGVLESFGTLTRQSPGTNTPHGPLTRSPLVTELPTRVMLGDPAALANAQGNLFARMGFGADTDPLGDFAVRVIVSSQETPRDFEGRTYYGGALGELVRRVDVEIYRISDLGRTSDWKPVQTLDRYFLVPVESLSTTASRELDGRHVPYDHRPFKEVLRDRLARRPGFEEQDLRTLDIYTLLGMIFTEVNQEHFLVEATSLLPPATPPPAITGMRQRIEQLAPARSGYLKLQRGVLMEEKALLTHDSFKRILGPLNELRQILEDMDVEVSRSRQTALDLERRSGTLATAFSQIMSPTGYQFLLETFGTTQQQLGSHLQENARLLATMRLIEHVLARPHMRAAFERLRQYPALFQDDLEASAAHFKDLSQDPEATPQVRAVAIRRWVNLTVVLRMVRGQAAIDPATRGHVTALMASTHGQFPVMTDYMDQNPLPRPLPELVTRNEGFTARLPALRGLAETEGLVSQATQRHGPDGSSTQYLDALGTTAGQLYVSAIKAISGAGRLRLDAARSRQTLVPVLKELQPILEESLTAGVTTPDLVLAGAPSTQAARLRSGDPDGGSGGGHDPDDDSRSRPHDGPPTPGHGAPEDPPEPGSDGTGPRSGPNPGTLHPSGSPRPGTPPPTGAPGSDAFDSRPNPGPSPTPGVGGAGTMRNPP